MRLCPECYLQYYCRNLQSRIVRETQLTPAFVDDLREHARALNIAPGRWSWFLLEAYRDYPGLIVDERDREVEVDIDIFFELLSIRYWFRDFLKPRAPGTVTRLNADQGGGSGINALDSTPHRPSTFNDAAAGFAAGKNDP